MDSNFPDVVLRAGGGRRCRVLFSYSPQNDDELQLQVNDEIDFLAEVEDGWWKGKLGNKIGVFPSNFVCELNAEESCPSEGEISATLSSPESGGLTLDEAPLLPPKPVKETCRVLFAYEAANDDELTLKKDDVITIITKEVEDKGWWKGELRGKVGLFPDNFVELMPPPEDAVHNQQKKPDRPSKTFEKVEGKSPLISSAGGGGFQKIIQEAEDQKSEALFGAKKNGQNKTGESPGGKFGEKNLNFYPPAKPDSTASHRKSLDSKTEIQPPTIVAKKPVLPPPLSNKPKPTPTGGKSSQVKRLSEEINDLIENAANKSPGTGAGKRLSGDVHDLVDGGVASKIGSGAHLQGGGGAKEDFDLDAVERSDMLTHMTSSRPRPPGRRLPTKETKENEPHGPLTNGNVETNDKEKSQKEREWEKHKPPWVNELKLNLKSNKTSPSDSKMDKKSHHSGQAKSATQSPVEASPPGAVSSESPLAPGIGVTTRQFSPQSGGGPRVQSMFESGSKVSELSSKFSKPLSPPKPSEVSWNSVADQSSEDVQVSKKEFVELKTKVERLEKLIIELTGQLCEESEKRKILEKELNKLTNLVTQV